MEQDGDRDQKGSGLVIVLRRLFRIAWVGAAVVICPASRSMTNGHARVVAERIEMNAELERLVG
jgi:hypothetical protein